MSIDALARAVTAGAFFVSFAKSAMQIIITGCFVFVF